MANVNMRPVGSAILSILLFAAVYLSGCNSVAPVATEPGMAPSATSAGFLESYQTSGGEVQEISPAAPTISANVADVVGTIPAYEVTGGNPPCAGYVQRLPNLVFSVTEGAGDLKVSFVGDSGTTLLVISDGQTVICDPSAPVVLTPELTLQDPSPGHYGVWVARANVQRPINGLLTVSFAQ